jgi:hypothetical protein
MKFITTIHALFHHQSRHKHLPIKQKTRQKNDLTAIDKHTHRLDSWQNESRFCQENLNLTYEDMKGFIIRQCR